MLGVCATALCLAAFASPAQATPFHARTPALDLSGLNHACGTAVDSKGDVYLASAGESKVKVFDPAHVLLTEITDVNTPCGLAVTTTGNLYVSEQATGNVVRFHPSEYPPTGSTTYSETTVDSSGKAKGIAVDPFDNRLYVAEGTKVAVYTSTGSFEANVGEGTLTEASAVAAYTYSREGGQKTTRYLWVADAKGILPDRLYLFGGRNANPLALRRELTGSTTPDGSFGFGAKGADLAADPGNRDGAGKCIVVGEQACTAGHLFLYDAEHKALDEFDAAGEYLDQTHNAAFADAEPSAIAIDRSGVAGKDGTLYVTAGQGAGAKALAFAPLKAPSRKVLKKPSEEAGGLSQTLAGTPAVAVDSRGYVYAVGGGSQIHIYKPNGEEIKNGTKVLLEDKFGGKGAKPFGLAVDSTGKVYVLDLREEFQGEELVTYYTPSKYPPESTTTYERKEPAVVTPAKFPAVDNLIQAIAINPGPGPGKDQLFVTTRPETQEYDSAANGSGQLNGKFAEGLSLGNRQSIAVNGANGNVWFGGNPKLVSEVDPTGKEILSQFENTGAADGKSGFNPYVAVDQTDNHVVTFDGSTTSAREYDAAGSFVAQFGNFTEGLTAPYRVAVDSSCAIQGLTGSACEAFDPANGTAYVAFDDTNPSHPPYDVNAFGPLSYPEPAKHKLTVEKEGSGSGTITGGSAEEPSTINCGSTCSHEYAETAVVKLEATPGPHTKFKGWEGCENPEPTQGDCEVTPSANLTVKANFEAEVGVEFPLTAKKAGTGEATLTSTPEGIDCAPGCEEETAEFVEGTEVTLKAEVEPGSELLGWRTGDCEAETVSVHEGTCTVTMDEAKEAQAQLGEEHPLLSVSEEGNGEGTVTSTPAGISCKPTCTHKFDLNQAVTLKAKAAEGSLFTGWSGCDAEPSPSECEVQMGEARQVKATFEALPEVIAEPAHPILYTEATLNAEIDPASLETEYRFEYIDRQGFEEQGGFEGPATHHTATAALEAGEVPIPVSAPLFGLTEGTEYLFRAVAKNSVGRLAGASVAFVTQARRGAEECPNATYRFGLSANLPDCRAYELVTPAQTDGLIPYAADSATSASGGFSNWLTPQSGAEAGERLSYFTNGTLPGFEGNGVFDGYRAQRSAGDHPLGGWQSALSSPSYREAAPSFLNSPVQLGVTADQLYSVWESRPSPAGFPETLPGGVYLHTSAGFEVFGQGSLGSDLKALSRYVSPGAEHVIFASNAHLEPGAPPLKNAALYDRKAGSASAHVLTVPPDSASVEEEAEFADALRSKEQASFAGASEDGASVVFKAGVGLYARLNDAKAERISLRTARAGDTLSCTAGPLYEGQQELNQRHFQWLRNGAPIAGASGGDITQSTDYTAKAADEGKALQCLTVATELAPRSVAVSAPVWISPLQANQGPQPPAQIAAPTPANPGIGTLATCSPGSWNDATSFAYQWYDNGKEIAGATSQTYEVKAADVPGNLQCIVTGKNGDTSVARASGLTPTSPAPAEAVPVATAQALPKTTYAGTSEDGRYVFYALGDGKSPGRLFRFDTQSEEATEIANSGIFALVSPDGSHAFFSSKEALTGSEENENGEAAEAGKPNLYARDGTGTRFIGRLSAQDFKEHAFGGPAAENLAAWTNSLRLGVGAESGRAYAPSRSTQGGSAFVFQSHARLTAFDNEGVGEVYRYDPAAAAGQRLLCVSCDPSGAPPSADALLEDIRSSSNSPVKAKTMIANLTESGKEVFFQSFDRLLPEDANEVEDVYEWRAPGSGTPECTRPAGCLALISSGQGEVPSFLYGMSADGYDVFIQTKEKLVGMDDAGSPSIYDAREFGGIPEPIEAAPCQGDACQGQGALPPKLPAPASSGAGVAPGGEGEAPASSRCAKGKHRVKGRCVAAKHHKRHRRAKANRGGKR